MSEEVNKGFVCIWKIIHFNFYNSERKSCIDTPVFTTESLREIKWILKLFHDGNQIGCYITHDPWKSDTDISVRYELTNPEGVILVASEQLRCTFAKSKCSEKYFLIQRPYLMQEMLLWSENTLTLRCYMDYEDDAMLPVSACQVTTDFSERFSFSWPFNLSNELVKKQIRMADIPVEISFKYRDKNLHFHFLSNIKDEEVLFAWFELSLVNSEGSTMVSIPRMKIFCKNSENYKCAYTFHTWKTDIRDVKKIKCEISNSFKWMLNYTKIYLGRDKSIENNISKANHIKSQNFLGKGSQFLEQAPQQYQQEEFQQLQQTKSCSKSGHNAATDHECLSHLQRHLRSMFLDEKFTDVKLRVGEKTFFAHKSLLAARSPVFSAMFDQDMLESNTGVVEITDVAANSLKSFLEYIYTGTVEEMNFDVALDLLAIADKYEVEPLTRRCFNFLKSALSHKNVCEVLYIADMINHEELKLHVIDYITMNSTAILSSTQWAQLLKRNTALVSEVFLKMSIKFDGGARK